MGPRKKVLLITITSDIFLFLPRHFEVKTNISLRAHKSLPSPLSIRITLEDAHGRKSTITAQYVNGPLNLPTKKSKEDYDKKTYDLWFQCDDTDLETRVIAKVDFNRFF